VEVKATFRVSPSGVRGKVRSMYWDFCKECARFIFLIISKE
jgi:hypothetical protein